MTWPRIIVSLLLHRGALVKTERFRKPRYVGDPINTVRIFNAKCADELMLLDISASVEGRDPDWELLRELAEEAFMPLAYGGGLRTIEQIVRVVQTGFEKIVLNTAAATNPELVRAAVSEVGAQSVVVSVDVQRDCLGRPYVVTRGARERVSDDPIAWCQRMEDLGAGELLLTAVDRDGTFRGYDLPLLREITAAVRIPVIASGGARGLPDFLAAFTQGGASGVAAGSTFVYRGPHRAVLVNYPTEAELLQLQQQIVAVRRGTPSAYAPVRFGQEDRYG
jgi:cyclase